MGAFINKIVIYSSLICTTKPHIIKTKHYYCYYNGFQVSKFPSLRSICSIWVEELKIFVIFSQKFNNEYLKNAFNNNNNMRSLII